MYRGFAAVVESWGERVVLVIAKRTLLLMQENCWRGNLGSWYSPCTVACCKIGAGSIRV